MNLVIAAEIFPPDRGGPATYVTHLAPELLQAGIQLKVVTYADVPAVITDKRLGYSVIKIPRHNIFLKFLFYTRELKKLAKETDLIFAQGPIASGLPTLLVKRFTGKKAVMKIVGDVAWERAKNRFGIKETTDEFQAKRYNFKIEFNRFLEHFIAKRMDKIIVPSEYLKRIVSGWGVWSEKIQVIYNALEKIPENSSKDEACHQLGLSGKILLSIGRLAPWKGFDTLISLMPRLLKKHPDLQLVIIGDGPMKESLKLQVSSIRLGDNVKLVGSVPHQGTGKYYRAADIFVLNSGYEGLSHVLLEALAMEVPVVASNIGGNPEVITDGLNGYLAEYNNQEQLFNKINSLLSDSVKQQQFKQAGLKKLEQFTFERMIKETYESINDLGRQKLD